MKSKTKKTTAKKKPAKKKPVRAHSPAAKKKTARVAKKKATPTAKTTASAKKKTTPTKKKALKKTAPEKKPALKKKPVKKTAASGSKKKVVTKRSAKEPKPIPRPTTMKKAAKKTARRAAPPAAPARKKGKAKGKPKSPPMTDGSVSVVAFTPYQERKGEEYMNEDQVEHFRDILFGWKRQLMEEVDRTLHHMQDEAANFPDPNDRATQESEFTLELRTRDRERKLIRKIDEAVMTLETGDYGFCEACGVEIGIRRLEARPTATLCIDCKVLDEIREKQMG